MTRQIYLARPDITPQDRKAVLDVLKTPYLSLGPKLQEFEEMLARYVGRKYAVAVNSGTSALHLAIRALGIGKDDEVITTPFSFVASANCMLFEKARPVFTDIDPETFCIDPAKIEKKITRKTKAILVVDVFGHPADWDTILSIARRHRLKVIEDSAEALGSTYKGKMCGSFGDAGVLSFYPNKQVTTGEGGALLTKHRLVAQLALSMRNQGRDIQIQNEKGKSKNFQHKSILEHVRLGYNYRISDINCALGIAQLTRIKKIIEKRETVAQMYNEQLTRIPGIEIPHIASWAKVSRFVYVVKLSPRYQERDRDAIIAKLRTRGIQASNYFPCIHLQPFYKKRFGYRKGDFPIAEGISTRTLALPFYNTLTKKEVNFVVTHLKALLT